jgi:hypothetical protein
MAGVATNSILAATVITGLAIFNHDSYNYKAWHTTLLMWAFTMIPVFWNFYFRKFLSTVEIISGICFIIFFFITVIVLAALAKHSTSEFVFKTLVHDQSGWEDPLICWGIGIVPVSLMLSGKSGRLKVNDHYMLTWR